MPRVPIDVWPVRVIGNRPYWAQKARICADRLKKWADLFDMPALSP